MIRLRFVRPGFEIAPARSRNVTLEAAHPPQRRACTCMTRELPPPLLEENPKEEKIENAHSHAAAGTEVLHRPQRPFYLCNYCFSCAPSH